MSCRRSFLAVLCSVLLATGGAVSAEEAAGGCPAELTPEALVDHVDRLVRGDSSSGRVTMEVVTRRWKRTMTLDIASQGKEMALIRVVAPRKEAGTATLKVEDDIWNYLPKIDRTIRVPTSMMMGSWMGSHFTNDDLVKDSQLVRDYTITVAGDREKDGRMLRTFELTPREEAAVVWGKILMSIRIEDCMPVSMEYFGEDGKLRRTLRFSDYREMGGRLVPAMQEMIPENKPGESTRIVYEELDFHVTHREGTFSLTNLRR